MAEVVVPRELFGEILRLIDGLRPRQALSVETGTVGCVITMGRVRPNDGKEAKSVSRK
jgi:hypothetical protein